MHGYVFVDNLQVVIIGLLKFGLIIVEELIRIGIMCLLLIGKPNKSAHHSYYTNRNFDTMKLALVSIQIIRLLRIFCLLR